MVKTRIRCGVNKDHIRCK